MNIQYGQPNESTNSIGKVSFITSTVAAFALSGFTPVTQDYNFGAAASSALVGDVNPVGLRSMYDWEARLKGTESSGSCGDELYFSDASNFSQLYAFALNFLAAQTDISSEFDKVFQESFWDILA